MEVYSNQEGVQLYTTNFLPDPCGNVCFSAISISNSKISFLSFLKINPATFVSENYYEVDGVLTTKLEQVNIAMKDKVAPKCSDDTAVVGKGGVHYLKHGAFCLETQKFPDAVHQVSKKIHLHLNAPTNIFFRFLQENFPSTILNPGQIYKHEVVFKFGSEA